MTTYITANISEAPREIVQRRTAEAHAYLDRLPAWWPRVVAVIAVLLSILALAADSSIVFAGIRSSMEDSNGKIAWLLAIPIVAIAGLVAIFVKLVMQKIPVEIEAVICITVAIWALISLYNLGSTSFAHATASASANVSTVPANAENPFAESESESESVSDAIISIRPGTYGTFAVALAFLAALLLSLVQRAINQMHERGRALLYIEKSYHLEALEQEQVQLLLLKDRLPEIERATFLAVTEKAIDLYSQEVGVRREEAQQMLDYTVPKNFYLGLKFITHRNRRPVFVSDPNNVIARADRCLENALQLRRQLAQGSL